MIITKIYHNKFYNSESIVNINNYIVMYLLYFTTTLFLYHEKYNDLNGYYNGINGLIFVIIIAGEHYKSILVYRSLSI